MDHPFEMGKEYRNRKGRYEVLAIDGPKMHVRYEDGSESKLTIAIQVQILEGIQLDESMATPVSKRSRRKSGSSEKNAGKDGATRAYGSNFYTHYWKNEIWDSNAERNDGSLGHTAGNLFLKRGVVVGDWIYIVTVKKGILFAAGKLRVGKIIGQSEAIGLFSGLVWDAEDHIISDKEYSSNFDCRIPVAVYPNLLFETVTGPKAPHLIDGGLLYQQTLRGLRRLTPKGAKLLDVHMQNCR